jgi:hypothetical protein
MKLNGFCRHVRSLAWAKALIHAVQFRSAGKPDHLETRWRRQERQGIGHTFPAIGALLVQSTGY